MAENIVILKTHLLQSCKDFFLANNLDPRRWTHNRHTGEIRTHYIPLMFNADINRPEDPDGYAAEITIMDKKIIMPAGRMVHISYEAGHVYSIGCTLPLDTISSFEEMKLICRDIAAPFEPLGFKPLRKNDQMTEREFHEKGSLMYLYGKWQINYPVPMDIVIEMKNFNRMATTSFTTLLTEPTPRNAQPAYLLAADVSLEGGVHSELIALRRARDLAINGDRHHRLPLKVWFDDPDWRPDGWQGKWLK